MYDFQVGDKVRSLVDNLEDNERIHKGTTGVVVALEDWGGDQCVGIQWDFKGSYGPGHDCGGYAENGRGWWIYPDNLKYLELLIEAEDTPINTADMDIKFLF